ncbi:hypothetical protein [Undibacterium seohonense]|nr:hypothetical protein [Undibacterium seohonense]
MQRLVGYFRPNMLFRHADCAFTPPVNKPENDTIASPSFADMA